MYCEGVEGAEKKAKLLEGINQNAVKCLHTEAQESAAKTHTLTPFHALVCYIQMVSQSIQMKAIERKRARERGGEAQEPIIESAQRRWYKW